jgi:hypothetical protein
MEPWQFYSLIPLGSRVIPVGAYNPLGVRYSLLFFFLLYFLLYFILYPLYYTDFTLIRGYGLLDALIL